MRLSKKSFFSIAASALICLSGCIEAFPAAEGKFERTLSVTGSVDLHVSTGAGKIEVRAGNSGMVLVYGFIKARDDRRAGAQEKVRYLEANPPIEQNGNSIRIGRIPEEAYRNNISINYELIVPAETRLRAETGSGSQRINDIRGPVNANTGSGSIAMFGIGAAVTARTGSGSIELDAVAGRVEASTGSGSIRAERVQGAIRAGTGSGSITLEQTMPERSEAADVEASTGSGSIRISGAFGPLAASTGSGGITATGNPGGDWKLHSSSGDVTLYLNRDAAFDLYAHSSSGRMTLDHPLTVMGTISRHELRGKVRGGGNLVDVRTSSGRIVIQ
ncbi:MAG: DUF4097 domain-containing protein [Acidobacteria bacterium]|nr:DUF4097 domain-containing protein [Acidobacteriota bacterium]